MKENQRLFAASVVPLALLFIMWTVQLFTDLFHLDLGVFGVFPRTLLGLRGILFMPLIHGSWEHLWSNSVGFLVLGTTLFFFYPKQSLSVFFWLWFLVGLWVWAFARPNYHIGASGLVYGLASFLFFFGIFNRNVLAMVITVLIGIFYGSIWWGALPLDPAISWEGHSLGLVAGLLMAWIYRKAPLPYTKNI